MIFLPVLAHIKRPSAVRHKRQFWTLQQARHCVPTMYAHVQIFELRVRERTAPHSEVKLWATVGRSLNPETHRSWIDLPSKIFFEELRQQNCYLLSYRAVTWPTWSGPNFPTCYPKQPLFSLLEHVHRRYKAVRILAVIMVFCDCVASLPSQNGLTANCASSVDFAHVIFPIGLQIALATSPQVHNGR